VALALAGTEAVNLTLVDFEQQLRALCRRFFPNAILVLRSRRIRSLSCRIHVTSLIFIDIYYNEQSDRLDFSTIQAEQRVFGYDNAGGGWHRHPFGQPDRHEPCAEPTLEQMFAATSQVIEQLLKC
jgi:hypothetical protein